MEILITSIIFLILISAIILYYQNKQSRLLAEKAGLLVQLENLSDTLEKEKSRIQQWESQLVDKFETIAHRITHQNTEHFKKDSTEQLDNALKPFSKTIERIEKQIRDTHESRIRDTSELRTELKQLGKLNHELQVEASNLTNALTLSPKHQGNWGEQVLETLLDKAGLVKNLHYHREVSGITDDKRLRADVIINLPDDRHLVVDSKVSLTAYNRYVNAEKEQAEAALKEHLTSVKNHIDTLAHKRYEDLYQINSPDMIFMFMPIEGSLLVAVRHDPELFHYAMERNVMLTTSSTLFVSLRIVSDLWQRDKQYENAELIAKEAGKLHGQVLMFMEEMTNIEKGLDQARNAYDQAHKRLTSGNNNVIRVATRIEDLGARVKVGKEGKNTLKKLVG